ncbi:N-methylhydantoinase B [Paraburkholderia unamae]|uniref:hydantoinase B/oxoprolinase family protein n=1 Tax=Paraburkholderia unamae TaxID=219649 RepID=UPI001CAB3A2D|nr:hydantoinase B/oxoprolinase family protein [Paraburkholderia unamae]CAG9267672.1 N-methylhydantoinase B [Paraburkholderia unamae]
MSVNPFDNAIISQSVLAAAREMGAKLIRSAYSTILREASDGSAAISNVHGDIIAQAELIPIQLGPIGITLKECLARFPAETLTPDAFMITNDPYSGGQHLPDVYIFCPIFYGDRLIGFSASVAHQIDFGGGAPGLDPGATDIYQEGLRLPPTLWSRSRDWNGGPLEQLVRANIRVPDLTIGDMNAMFAANAIAAARLVQLCDKYGADTVTEVMHEMVSYSERRFRAAVAQLPEGVYYGEDMIDDDGVTDEPLLIKVKVAVTGDAIDIDFTGSSPQVRRNLNSPFSCTVSAAVTCVKSILTSPDIPFNDGILRAVRVSAPYGSILNPAPPSPVRARLEANYRIYNAIMRALAPVAPDKVIATGFDTLTAACFSLQRDESFSVYLEIFGGGYGASQHGDGCDAVDSPLSNCANTPVEALDMEYDFFRLERYTLEPDSFGSGKYRGGAGFSREYVALKDGVVFAIYSDRHRNAPQGLFGGESGQCGYCELTRNGVTERLPSKSMVTLNCGDRIKVYMGGGGGYGNVAERLPALHEADIRDGMVAH